ncbi:pilus assembly protein N-terminal domain-containing protein [Cucumibacter marinus]|uniref:pilus assembly protein N-terminal domain-containing protein n=1 Tax=Cucumibacter marinus TaxID=1121252 RepID=UPI00041B5F99|nr:pilus assembly protein N-terminal domain-containing protein [Cucumibacter marinus]
MSPRAVFISAVAALAISLGTPAVQAAGPSGELNVMMNMARVLRLPSAATTVIVGNPGVADVTIQDPQTLILTGKSYGRTNLIALDEVGNPIADLQLEVVRGDTELVTVFLGSARTTMACEPDCLPVIMAGDDSGFTAATISSSKMVEQNAR